MYQGVKDERHMLKSKCLYHSLLNSEFGDKLSDKAAQDLLIQRNAGYVLHNLM